MILAQGKLLEALCPLIFLIGFTVLSTVASRIAAKKNREAAAHPPPRQDTPAPPRPAPRPAPRASEDEVERFLRELTGQPPIAPRPRPQPPQRPAPTTATPPPTTVPRAQTTPQPAARAPATPRTPAVAAASRRPPGKVPQRIEPSAPVQRVGAELHQAAPSMEIADAVTAVETAAERLERLLPEDPMRRAMLLREILGPCRAFQRHGPAR